MKASLIPISVNCIDSYLASIANILILSHEEEINLASRAKHDNCTTSAEQLAYANLRFVANYTLRFSGYSFRREDLIQEGNIGLLKAIKRFDPDRGVRFISFAVHSIKSEINEYIIGNSHLLKVATTKAQRKLFF